jgi:predicted small secreted protein
MEQLFTAGSVALYAFSCCCCLKYAYAFSVELLGVGLVANVVGAVIPLFQKKNLPLDYHTALWLIGTIFTLIIIIKGSKIFKEVRIYQAQKYSRLVYSNFFLWLAGYILSFVI